MGRSGGRSVSSAVHSDQQSTVIDVQTALPEVPGLKPSEYYRLPWSLTDNGISWLDYVNWSIACVIFREDAKSHTFKISTPADAQI